MENKHLSSCLGCALICISSVAFSQKDFFIPKALIMPFHNRQQQLYVSAGYGGGYDINLSYSLSQHFALFTTGTLNNGTKTRTAFFGDPYNIIKHDRVLTYGAGYFTQPKGKLNVLETYAGYGAYQVKNYWFFTSDPYLGNNYTQASYRNIFWQVNFGRKTTKYEYGFAGRLSYSSYKNVLFYDSNPNTVYEKIAYKNVKGINFDPAVCFGYHIKTMSINIQAGISAPVTSSKLTAINTFTTLFNGVTETTVQEDKQTKVTEPLIAAFARLSLQYTIHVSKPRHVANSN